MRLCGPALAQRHSAGKHPQLCEVCSLPRQMALLATRVTHRARRESRVLRGHSEAIFQTRHPGLRNIQHDLCGCLGAPQPAPSQTQRLAGGGGRRRSTTMLLSEFNSDQKTKSTSDSLLFLVQLSDKTPSYHALGSILSTAINKIFALNLGSPGIHLPLA